MKKADKKSINSAASVRCHINGKKSLIHVNTRLDYIDYGSTIESIVRALYVNGDYKPYLKRYVTYSVLIERYTDYKGVYSPEVILPLCEKTSFYKKITSKIDRIQLRQLYADIDELIQYKNSHPNKV